MIAICNGTDLSAYVGQGYVYARVPQYAASLTTMDGTDHSAKLRDQVQLTVPLIPVTLEKLTEILQLFPDGGAYVEWTFYDPFVGGLSTKQMKYDTRESQLRSVLIDGTEYYGGLTVKLIER